MNRQRESLYESTLNWETLLGRHYWTKLNDKFSQSAGFYIPKSCGCTACVTKTRLSGGDHGYRIFGVYFCEEGKRDCSTARIGSCIFRHFSDFLCSFTDAHFTSHLWRSHLPSTVQAQQVLPQQGHSLCPSLCSSHRRPSLCRPSSTWPTWLLFHHPSPNLCRP